MDKSMAVLVCVTCSMLCSDLTTSFPRSVKAQATILELLDNCGLTGVVGCMALEQVSCGCFALLVCV